MAQKFLRAVRSFDMYGHDVGVLYQGSSSYKTVLGTLISLAIYFLIITDLANLTIAFFDGGN